jgi:hypothetical protein
MQSHLEHLLQAYSTQLEFAIQAPTVADIYCFLFLLLDVLLQLACTGSKLTKLQLERQLSSFGSVVFQASTGSLAPWLIVFAAIIVGQYIIGRFFLTFSVNCASAGMWSEVSLQQKPEQKNLVTTKQPSTISMVNDAANTTVTTCLQSVPVWRFCWATF